LVSELFDPKTGFFDSKSRKLFPNLFLNYFREIFGSSKSLGFSEKIPNFENRNFRLTQGLGDNVLYRDSKERIKERQFWGK